MFGLVLAGAFAIDALWNAEPSQRKPLALRWAAFGLAALAACCVTPYGWESILASRKILDLGELLRLISEWAPADFSKLSPFEFTILVLIAGALYRGVRLSPPRIALVLGLLHMALSHGRNLEIFALLLPIVVLTPVSQQFALQPNRQGRVTFASAALLAAALGISTWALAAHRAYAPPKTQSPAAAVEAVKAHNLQRVLNDRAFGGYLIWRQMPVFIDGRAELYGEKFTMAYYNALELKDVSQFLALLKDNDIDGCCCSRVRRRRVCSIISAPGGASMPTMWPSFICAAESTDERDAIGFVRRSRRDVRGTPPCKTCSGSGRPA